MANERYDIDDVYQGINYSLGAIVRDDDGLPLDITDYSITGTIKYHYSDPSAVIYFDVAKVEPYASGAFTISLDDDDTQLLSGSQYIYDVRGTLSGDARQLLFGYLNVYP